MFDITGQYKATEDAYKSLKHQMNKNEVVDASGLFGPRHRMKEIHRGKQQKISEFEQLEAIVAEDNKLRFVFAMIREIDKQKNGYVTDQELQDIFKECYPDKLRDFEFKGLFQRFSLGSNRLLIDYNQLRNFFFQRF